MTRAETLAAIKTNPRLSGHCDDYHCDDVSECERCAIGWLLQEIEDLTLRLTVANDVFAVRSQPLLEANRILAADRERFKDALRDIACGTYVWEREEMIDTACAALLGVKE